VTWSIIDTLGTTIFVKPEITRCLFAQQASVTKGRTFVPQPVELSASETDLGAV
jgi:hypothetical protein